MKRDLGQGKARAAKHPGGGGTWVFYGWVCAARDSELAPRSKKKFLLKLIPLSRNGPIFYTPF